MTQFVVILLNDLSFPSESYCADRSIVGNRYVSNAAMTLATVSATIPVLLFLSVRAGTAYRHLFHVAGTDVEMC